MVVQMYKVKIRLCIFCWNLFKERGEGRGTGDEGAIGANEGTERRRGGETKGRRDFSERSDVSEYERGGEDSQIRWRLLQIVIRVRH